MEHIIAFIPLRGGSKSIPLKNIKLFCGKPLVYWNLIALQDTSEIDKIVIATDSIDIENVVNEFNFSKVEVYRRLPQNAKDSSSTEDVMLEYISSKADSVSEKDIFVLVQATSPFTQSCHFKEAIQKFNKNNFDSLLSCVPFKRFLWNRNGTPQNYDINNRPRRQEFEGELIENGAFYLSKVRNIKESRCRLSGKIGFYEMPEYTMTEIDEEDDWLIAEALMRKHQRKGNDNRIKILFTDVDGVLTDAGMYYSETGDELKKFSTYDGKAFELLRAAGVKTGIITTEKTEIVRRRAEKLQTDFVFQGLEHNGKLKAVMKVCEDASMDLSDVAYIGDDINCFELLSAVGFPACPNNAVEEVKGIPGILKLNRNGGEGVVREFVDLILSERVGL